MNTDTMLFLAHGTITLDAWDTIPEHTKRIYFTLQCGDQIDADYMRLCERTRKLYYYPRPVTAALMNRN